MQTQNKTKEVKKKVKVKTKLQYNGLLNDPTCKEIYVDKFKSKYNLDATGNSKWNTLYEALIRKKIEVDDGWNSLYDEKETADYTNE